MTSVHTSVLKLIFTCKNRNNGSKTNEKICDFLPCFFISCVSREIKIGDA